MSFLELKAVGKGYGVAGERTEVLTNINLSIAKGEFVAIVGYSGAGKTTLVSMVGGLIKPDTGTITMDGKPIRGPGPERGVVFQNYSLLPWLSVFENVFLAVDQVFPKKNKAEKIAHTERYVAMVNLSHALDRKPAQLSGGMRQRVALARALAMEPEILLLDEPLGALDALTRATLQDELARICRVSGKTILLITNDVDEGILLADRIIPLGAGPSASLGPSIEVTLARPRDRKALNHDPAFKSLRAEVIEYLLGSAKKKRAIKKNETPAPMLAMDAEALR
jgi:nitrate/nitrite transport system ATP-binding protein